MKKLYVLLPIALLSFSLFAQNPVLNPSFESWTGSTPNNWSTGNSVAGNPVTKVTPGYNSASAVKLTAIVISGQGTVVPFMLTENNGFPVTHGYSHLELWYKASFVSADVCNVAVSFLDASEQGIGGGAVTISQNTSTFTHVDIPLSIPAGTPVKCQIAFTVINPNGGLILVNPNSTITIDEVALTGVIGIDELKDGSDLVVYPNPVQNRLLMQVTATPGEKISWVLTDASGRIVADKKSENYSAAELKDEMLLPDLAKGIYLLSMQSDLRRASRRVVVQ